MREPPPNDVRQHLPALTRYAVTLTRDAASADDLVQQALLNAIERSDSFRPGFSLKGWLMAILHNQFIDGRRRAGVEQRALDHLAERRELEADGTVPPQEQALLLADVAARFDRLSAEHRAVLHLIAVEGLSYRQAADALGIPVGTVMSRLSRARAALRDAAEAKPASTLRIIGGSDAI